jgi:hypothetical protein
MIGLIFISVMQLVVLLYILGSLETVLKKCDEQAARRSIIELHRQTLTALFEVTQRHGRLRR